MMRQHLAQAGFQMSVSGEAVQVASRTARGSSRMTTVLGFVFQYWEANHFSPTIREIASYFGLKSTSLVSYYLGRLEKQGYIRREKRKARGIVLLDPRRKQGRNQNR